MKNVKLAAWFPEERYARDNNPLQLVGFGAGSSLAIAVNRAFRDLMSRPEMRHKSPLHIYLSAGIDDTEPIQFWHFFRRDQANSALDAALDIARQEEEKLDKMRSALERGDDKESLRWARELCGMGGGEHKPCQCARPRFAFEIRMDGETEWRRIEIDAKDLKEAEGIVFCMHNLYGYRVIG